MLQLEIVTEGPTASHRDGWRAGMGDQLANDPPQRWADRLQDYATDVQDTHPAMAVAMRVCAALVEGAGTSYTAADLHAAAQAVRDQAIKDCTQLSEAFAERGAVLEAQGAMIAAKHVASIPLLPGYAPPDSARRPSGRVPVPAGAKPGIPERESAPQPAKPFVTPSERHPVKTGISELKDDEIDAAAPDSLVSHARPFGDSDPAGVNPAFDEPALDGVEPTRIDLVTTEPPDRTSLRAEIERLRRMLQDDLREVETGANEPDGTPADQTPSWPVSPQDAPEPALPESVGPAAPELVDSNRVITPSSPPKEVDWAGAFELDIAQWTSAAAREAMSATFATTPETSQNTRTPVLNTLLRLLHALRFYGSATSRQNA